MTEQIQITDSHCHLDFDTFDDERADVIARAVDAGVTRMVTICTKLRLEPQVRAIAEAVRMQVKEQAGERPWKREGTQHNQWVVLDYVNVVVHVFDRERRAYYDLERLWGDAPVEHVAEDAETVELLQPESK